MDEPPCENRQVMGRSTMRQRLVVGVRVLVAAGLVVLTAATAVDAQLAPGRDAPEITAGNWINSAPLTIGGLRGRVVAVEFWTFG
jgi:hypothetical protein